MADTRASTRAANHDAPQPGPSVDAFGRAVPDPSLNVKELNQAGLESLNSVMEAAIKRLDDLADERHTGRVALDALRERRLDDLRVSESAHIRELMGVRDGFLEQLRRSEIDFRNAIRTIDINAGLEASRAAANAAEALRQATLTLADTLRIQVANVADAAAKAGATQAAEFRAAIESLRQAQYVTQGATTTQTATSAITQEGQAAIIEGIVVRSVTAATRPINETLDRVVAIQATQAGAKTQQVEGRVTQGQIVGYLFGAFGAMTTLILIYLRSTGK